MSAGQNAVARLLVLAAIAVPLTACASPKLEDQGTVTKVEPQVCVKATTGANYCFDRTISLKKVADLQEGDCVIFAHTAPPAPGAQFRLESMSRCEDAEEDAGDQ